MRAGPYELLEKVGQGGMGVVWRGCGPDGKHVAVKLLARWASREARARFDRERRLLGSLGPEEGFVGLLDAGESESGPYIVMPFLAGGTLREKLARGPLGVAATLALGRTLAQSLARAHARGIVHRDLKPENILFDRRGEPLVADLGLAKHFRHDSPGASQSVNLSHEGSSRGTRGYMPPEQAEAAEKAGAPADVFALGVILYECLVGAGPFDGGSALEALARVHEREYTRVRSACPEAPAWLAAAIERSLEPAPDARFPDAAALALALESVEPADAPPAGRRALLLGVAGALAVAIAVALGLVAWARSGGPGTHAAASSGPSPAPTPPRASPSPSARPVVSPIPAWYSALPPAERPAYPLPRGLRFGARPGEYVNEKDGSVLLYVPAGTFTMGSPDAPDDGPVHEVELSAYFVGKLEVSNAQWAAFAAATGHRTQPEVQGSGDVTDEQLLEFVPTPGASWRTPAGHGKLAPANLPVVLVTWDDAVAYVDWAGLALPTEAQWERAATWDARAHKARRYAWGDERLGKGSPRVANVADESLRPWRPYEVAIFAGYDDGYVGLAPVGSFPAGASPVGALDMTGNAIELCQDTFSPDWLGRSPRKDPCCREDGRAVVMRGGNYADLAEVMRATFRDAALRDRTHDRVGFRVARPAE